jgi:hypothetical protein
MKGLSIGIFARLAKLNEECAELMPLGRFANRLKLVIVSTDDAAVFDHDIFAAVLRNQFFLVLNVELELGLEGGWHGRWHNIDTKAVLDKQRKMILARRGGRDGFAERSRRQPKS